MGFRIGGFSFLACGIFFFFPCFATPTLQEEYPRLFDRFAPHVTSMPIGEFGNQLFQAATGISLALDNNAQYIHRTNTYEEPLNKFYSTVRKRTRFIYAPCGQRDDNQFPYSPIPYRNNMRLEGYFQSYKYFHHRRDDIRKLFAPSKEKVAYLKKKYPFLTKEKETVALHIRTYKKDAANHTFDELYAHFAFPPNLPFLENAIAYFDGDPLFVVCSDTIEWAKKALAHIKGRFVFVHDSLINDFYVLTLCSHCIVSNSTFSWWAAYLNHTEHPTVIVPVPFKIMDHHQEDILLDEWIQMERVDDGMIPDFDGGKPFRKSKL